MHAAPITARLQWGLTDLLVGNAVADVDANKDVVIAPEVTVDSPGKFDHVKCEPKLLASGHAPSPL